MSELFFAFLGPIQLSHPQLGEITITKRKALALLVYLVTEADHPHPRESLLGMLWPEYSTAAAQNNLRVTWSQLQKYLEKAEEDAQPFLLSNRLDLQFNPLSRYKLDVSLFRSLIESCRTHTHSGQPEDCAVCADRLGQAVQLVRGPFLEGLSLSECPGFDEWLYFQRERLNQQITAALEHLGVFHERNGRAAEAETCVRRLLELDPLREQAHLQLMRLLAGAGQRSAALAQYETCRRLLADELGVSPAPETTLLAEQIRMLAAVQNATPSHNLPPSFTRFIGRDQEQSTIEDLMANRGARVVTLAGPGGVGKTRLALRVASQLVTRFPNGVWMVELAGINSALAVPAAMASALGSFPEAGRPLEDTLEDFLRDKSLLLILDNCEHLIESCAQLVKTLISAAPGLVILITSRVPLHLEGEHVVRLDSLSTPQLKPDENISAFRVLQHDAVQLFASWASHALMNFTITDANAPAVAQICQQLDGMPLAIELAAARVRFLPVEDIASRLDQRFRWRNAQSDGKLSRQQTLRTMIDWSYDLLDDQERVLFERLSVFAGGWDLAAAEAICSEQETCADILGQLVDQSLVVFGYDSENKRYRMHETIRQFAREQLHTRGEEPVILKVHARYYEQVVSKAVDKTWKVSHLETLHQLDNDHDNLRAALAWALNHNHTLALEMAANLGTELKFWELAGFFQEGRHWLTRILEVTAGTDSVPRARALLAAAKLSSAISDLAYGQVCASESWQIFHQLGDRCGEIDARLDSAELAYFQGNHNDLAVLLNETTAIAGEIGYPAGLAKGEWLLGKLLTNNHQYEQAIQHLVRSTALWRELDQPYELGVPLNSLADTLTKNHQYTDAWGILQETVEINRSLGYQRGVAHALQNLGEVATELRDFTRARELFQESLRIRRSLGLRRGYAYSFEGLAYLAEHENRAARAIQLFAAAHTLRLLIGAPLDADVQAQYDQTLANLHARLRDVFFGTEWSKGAAMTLEQALDLALSE
jgi:predicted ATPase/DNA-binding SARP family transcriptional activator